MALPGVEMSGRLGGVFVTYLEPPNSPKEIARPTADGVLDNELCNNVSCLALSSQLYLSLAGVLSFS